MILLDANILIYAHNPAATQHAAARLWLEQVLADAEIVAVPWITLWAFLRISSNPQVNPQLRSTWEVFAAVQNLMGAPSVRVVEPGPSHLDLLEQLTREGKAGGRMLTDAALAALAIEHGATLVSTDQDFARFPGLKWINPLSQAK